MVPFYGVFTLFDIEADAETDKRWVEKNCVDVFILHRDRRQHSFPLGSELDNVYLSLTIEAAVEYPFCILEVDLVWPHHSGRRQQ